tara:strand:+ start:167 stop:463 length:297 start_codon:yes stop_codon:yes gene_type:complete
MKFIEIINHKKFTLISIFLFLYIILNLLDGERGLISYFEKQKIYNQLLQEKKDLLQELSIVEKKNILLTDTIDLDYLETLYRKKFLYGKSEEKIYLNN